MCKLKADQIRHRDGASKGIDSSVGGAGRKARLMIPALWGEPNNTDRLGGDGLALE